MAHAVRPDRCESRRQGPELFPGHRIVGERLFLGGTKPTSLVLDPFLHSASPEQWKAFHPLHDGIRILSRRTYRASQHAPLIEGQGAETLPYLHIPEPTPAIDDPWANENGEWHLPLTQDWIRNRQEAPEPIVEGNRHTRSAAFDRPLTKLLHDIVNGQEIEVPLQVVHLLAENRRRVGRPADPMNHQDADARHVPGPYPRQLHDVSDSVDNRRHAHLDGGGTPQDEFSEGGVPQLVGPVSKQEAWRGE